MVGRLGVVRVRACVPSVSTKDGRDKCDSAREVRPSRNQCENKKPPLPDVKRGYGVNLSILLTPGKENNCDSLSNGE